MELAIPIRQATGCHGRTDAQDDGGAGAVNCCAGVLSHQKMLEELTEGMRRVVNDGVVMIFPISECAL